MPTCFVIQPFDSGKFDKRFDDVYRPAMEAAGLEAYRVDRDPGVEIAIDAIEDGIRSATVCLADITADNPNVWYELGFAFAAGRPVVMVCSKERPGNKYPFDIQHRTIISYNADAPSDFHLLQHSITTRISTLLTKVEALRQIAEIEQVSTIQGLSQPELFVLAEIAGSIFMPDAGTAISSVKKQVEQVFTSVGFSLGLNRLRAKGFIEIKDEYDHNGYPYSSAFLTDKAWAWIDANERSFVIRRPEKNEDEIPF